MGQGGFNGSGGQFQVGHKFFVGAVGAVIWFQGRHLQELADKFEIAVQEERAVKQQIALAAALGITREFEVAEAKIGMALNSDLVGS